MFEVAHFSVSHGKVPVLNDVSFALRPGRLTALLGPNGCGKSTLLQALAGILPAQGEMRFGGGDVTPARLRRRLCAYMPQDASATSALSAIEVVLLGRVGSLGLRVARDMLEQAHTMLARFGLADMAGRGLGTLSGGQRQMVFLAQALFADPEVLLLDEPTSALDLRHQLVVLDHVRRICAERGIIAVAALHDPGQAARHAADVICLGGGGILAWGRPGEILHPDLLRRLYGVHVEVTTGPDGGLHITPLAAVEA